MITFQSTIRRPLLWTIDLTACRHLFQFSPGFLPDNLRYRPGSMKHQFNRVSLKSYPDCKGWALRSRRSSRCGGTPATWCWRCAHSWRWRGRCRWASCRPAGARCSCRSGSSEWSWGRRNATGSTCKSPFCLNPAHSTVLPQTHIYLDSSLSEALQNFFPHRSRNLTGHFIHIFVFEFLGLHFSPYGSADPSKILPWSYSWSVEYSQICSVTGSNMLN